MQSLRSSFDIYASLPPELEAPPTRASDVPPKTRSKGPPKGTTAVKVVSAGGDAGDIADFFLEDQQVPIGGMSNRRGLNVVVIDASAGHLLSAKTYDIWGNPLEENRRLAKDLRAVEEDRSGKILQAFSHAVSFDPHGRSECQYAYTFTIHTLIAAKSRRAWQGQRCPRGFKRLGHGEPRMTVFSRLFSLLPLGSQRKQPYNRRGRSNHQRSRKPPH